MKTTKSYKKCITKLQSLYKRCGKNIIHGHDLEFYNFNRDELACIVTVVILVSIFNQKSLLRKSSRENNDELSI